MDTKVSCINFVLCDHKAISTQEADEIAAKYNGNMYAAVYIDFRDNLKNTLTDSEYEFMQTTDIQSAIIKAQLLCIHYRLEQYTAQFIGSGAHIKPSYIYINVAVSNDSTDDETIIMSTGFQIILD